MKYYLLFIVFYIILLWYIKCRFIILDVCDWERLGFGDVWPAAPDRAARLLTSSATQHRLKPTSSLTAQPTNRPTVPSPTFRTTTYRRRLRVNAVYVLKEKACAFCGYHLHDRWKRIVLMSVNFSRWNTPAVTSAARSQRLEEAVSLRVPRRDQRLNSRTWSEW